MGALAHYLEMQGVPTTQISLIREHTAIIQPPRALWVPFGLGRPLGLPGDPAFQRRVLLAALKLLNLEAGPVLVDFPDDVSGKTEALPEFFDNLACPVSFTPASQGKTGAEKLLAAFTCEVAELRSWYDLGLGKRGYSAVAYFGPEAAVQLLSDFVLGGPLKFPENISAPAVALRLAVQDLKAFYFEAVMSRPNAVLPGTSEFNHWFWEKSVAGKVIKLIKETCLNSTDKQLKMTGGLLLVPLDQG